jgi:hypothetical protein
VKERRRRAFVYLSIGALVIPMRLRHLTFACLGLILSTAAASAQSWTAGLDAPQWAVFTDRHGTRVDYPAGIFSVEAGDVPRGEGRSLSSADGRARLLVYVEPNEAGYTPERFMRSLFTGAAAETGYKRIANHFFAVSGARESHIYYSRCNFPDGRAGHLHCVYLDYPKSEEKLWDGIVTRISLSLRPLRRRR